MESLPVAAAAAAVVVAAAAAVAAVTSVIVAAAAGTGISTLTSVVAAVAVASASLPRSSARLGSSGLLRPSPSLKTHCVYVGCVLGVDEGAGEAAVLDGPR